MSTLFKRIIFLIAISMVFIACESEGTDSSKSCKLDDDCSINQECRFNSKTATSGECVQRTVCQEDDECADQRACNITLEGEDKYCGGYLINFNFKSDSILKNAKTYEVYNETVELSGKTGAFFISVEGNLPDGLSLTPETGDISGTPTLKGDFTFKLIAYNGLSNSKYYFNIVKVEKEFSIKVDEGTICTPKTCASLNRECGSVDDGCGTSLDCGTCTEGTCNASGTCEVACVPDCSGGKICGDNGCGGTCGTCNANETCSADQLTCEAGQTLCEPNDRQCNTDGDKVETCNAEGTAWEVSDTCAAPQHCHPTFIICSCVENDLRCNNNNVEKCFGDGIWEATEECTNGDTCNSNTYTCESTCTPQTCNDLNRECGSVDDGCGTSLDCGTCTEGTCNASGTCEVACVPQTCDDLSAQCGTIDDGCGTDIDCGGCETNFECVQNLCESAVVINEGDIIISEFMADPDTATDTNGEWIELYNTTDTAIDLTGLKIVKGTTNYNVTLITTSIAANSYYLIARKESSVSLLPIVDATASFSLTNSGATLELKLGEVSLDTVVYTDTTAGESWQLDKEVMDFELNDDPTAWCLGTTEINSEVGDMLNTDKGTPGTENISCPVK